MRVISITLFMTLLLLGNSVQFLEKTQYVLMQKDGDSETDGADTTTDGGETTTDGGETTTDGGETTPDGSETTTDGASGQEDKPVDNEEGPCWEKCGAGHCLKNCWECRDGINEDCPADTFDTCNQDCHECKKCHDDNRPTQEEPAPAQDGEDTQPAEVDTTTELLQEDGDVTATTDADTTASDQDQPKQGPCFDQCKAGLTETTNCFEDCEVCKDGPNDDACTQDLYTSCDAQCGNCLACHDQWQSEQTAQGEGEGQQTEQPTELLQQDETTEDTPTDTTTETTEDTPTDTTTETTAATETPTDTTTETTADPETPTDEGEGEGEGECWDACQQGECYDECLVCENGVTDDCDEDQFDHCMTKCGDCKDCHESQHHDGPQYDDGFWTPGNYTNGVCECNCAEAEEGFFDGAEQFGDDAWNQTESFGNEAADYNLNELTEDVGEGADSAQDFTSETVEDVGDLGEDVADVVTGDDDSDETTTDDTTTPAEGTDADVTTPAELVKQEDTETTPAPTSEDTPAPTTEDTTAPAPTSEDTTTPAPTSEDTTGDHDVASDGECMCWCAAPVNYADDTWEGAENMGDYVVDSGNSVWNNVGSWFSGDEDNNSTNSTNGNDTTSGPSPKGPKGPNGPNADNSTTTPAPADSTTTPAPADTPADTPAPAPEGTDGTTEKQGQRGKMEQGQRGKMDKKCVGKRC